MGTRIETKFLFLAMTLLNRLVALFDRFQSTEADLRAQIADLSQQLADALADDAADDEAIAAAQAAADEAKAAAADAEAKAAVLQAANDEQADQLAGIEQLVAGLEGEQPA
jgi:cell division septum initiation protein DivIVA